MLKAIASRTNRFVIDVATRVVGAAEAHGWARRLDQAITTAFPGWGVARLVARHHAKQLHNATRRGN